MEEMTCVERVRKTGLAMHMSGPRVEYTVRESSRAKRVIIKVWPSNQVEVVVPKGFNLSRLPDILNRESGWISDQKNKYHQMTKPSRPDTINLRAINQVWKVHYVKESTETLSISENSDLTIMVMGQVNDAISISRILNQWLHRKARTMLGDWLTMLSEELSIPFNRLTVRRQKTLWGSCSSKKNINLNRNLLFLETSMVRYVLVHELCHVKRPDHSAGFWDLLEQYVQGARTISKKTKKAGEEVPQWARV